MLCRAGLEPGDQENLANDDQFKVISHLENHCLPGLFPQPQGEKQNLNSASLFLVLAAVLSAAAVSPAVTPSLYLFHALLQRLSHLFL